MSRPTITVSLTFAVDDEHLLRTLADDAIAEHGMGVEETEPADAPLAFRAAELLLHSNPNIPAYLDLGLELLRTDLADHG